MCNLSSLNGHINVILRTRQEWPEIQRQGGGLHDDLRVLSFLRQRRWHRLACARCLGFHPCIMVSRVLTNSGWGPCTCRTFVFIRHGVKTTHVGLFNSLSCFFYIFCIFKTRGKNCPNVRFHSSTKGDFGFVSGGCINSSNLFFQICLVTAMPRFFRVARIHLRHSSEDDSFVYTLREYLGSSSTCWGRFSKVRPRFFFSMFLEYLRVFLNWFLR